MTRPGGRPRAAPGSLLAQRRVSLHNCSLEEAGARSGVPWATIAAWERGRSRNPNRVAFARYAAWLQLPVEDALRLIPQWPITPWGGNPFARRGEHRVQLPHVLCRRAHRLCREWDRDMSELVADALARELDRIEGLPGEE